MTSKILTMAVAALMLLPIVTSCSEDKVPTQADKGLEYDLPAELFGVWTDQMSRKETAETGLLFNINKGVLSMRNFNLEDGSGTDYVGTIKFDKNLKTGKIIVNDANAPHNYLDVVMQDDGTMECFDKQKGDTLRMIYVAKSIAEIWDEHGNNVHPFDMGPGVTEPLFPDVSAKPEEGLFSFFTPSFVLEALVSDAITSLAGAGLSAVMDAIFDTEDPTASKLNEMSEQLQAIQKMVEVVSEKIDQQTYKKAYSERWRMYHDLVFDVDRIFKIMEESKDDSVRIMDNINDFCSGSLPRIEPKNAARAYIHQIDDIAKSTPNNSIQSVYDYIIYNSTPWEHEGYDKRLALRLADAAMVAKLAVINSMYWLYSTKVNMSKDQRQREVDLIKKDIEEYTRQCVAKDKELGFIIDGKVQRNEEYSICQIKGAKFKIKRKGGLKKVDMAAIFNKYSYGKGFYNPENYLYWEDGKDVSQVKEHCLTMSEINALRTYYGPLPLAWIFQNAALLEFDDFDLWAYKSHMIYKYEGKGSAARLETSFWYNDWHKFWAKNAIATWAAQPELSEHLVCEFNFYCRNGSDVIGKTKGVEDTNWSRAWVER